MKKVVRWIETGIKIVTVVLSIFTIIEGIKALCYKRKVAAKAQDYLEDEFAAEAYLGKTINVYSPTIKENNNRVKTLLAATGAGCIILIILSVLKLNRD